MSVLLYFFRHGLLLFFLFLLLLFKLFDILTLVEFDFAFNLFDFPVFFLVFLLHLICEISNVETMFDIPRNIIFELPFAIINIVTI